MDFVSDLEEEKSALELGPRGGKACFLSWDWNPHSDILYNTFIKNKGELSSERSLRGGFFLWSSASTANGKDAN